MRTNLFWTGAKPSACGSAVGHSGGGFGYKTNAFVSADGDRVAVLLLNGRAGERGDDRAGQAGLEPVLQRLHALTRSAGNPPTRSATSRMAQRSAAPMLEVKSRAQRSNR